MQIVKVAVPGVVGTENGVQVVLPVQNRGLFLRVHQELMNLRVQC